MINVPSMRAWEGKVAWVEPEYSRGEINRAGKTLIGSSDADERNRARVILGNWRSAHGYPLHALTQTLRNRSKEVAGGKGIVTQRRKRLVSVEHKLLRRPHTRATQIQDLGGCRIILPTIDDVRELQAIYGQRGSRVFDFHREDDYIENPKESGYRSLHLVYRYASDKKQAWRNMRVELQMRSGLQHMWATAVEAVSFFTGQDLKASEGDARWLRFFALMAHWTAFEERSAMVPGVPKDGPERFEEELEMLVNELDVDKGLAGWATSFRFLGQYSEEVRVAKSFLVHLDTEKAVVDLRGFREREEALASDAYSELEIAYADDPNHHVVLVTAESYKVLKQGYPGFFADTTRFRQVVGRAMAMASTRNATPARSNDSSPT